MSRARVCRHAVRLAAVLACALLAAACDMAPQAVRSGGTGSPMSASASGPITGLGSIVVNGIRFDETGARVTIDGVPDRTVAELQLGMVVEVRGEVDAAARTGRAQTVVATPLLSGPAGAIDLASGEVTVLGQRVEVKPGTVLEGASSLASLRAGDSVSVYGFWDYFGGHVDATRLEVRAAATSPPTAIIGQVGTVTGTRFLIGALTVESAGAALADLPGGIARGAFVEARGALDAGGVLQASRIAGRAEFSPIEGAFTEIEGYITDFAGVAAFRVLGLAVNGAAAQLTGVPGALSNGALVEVEGRIAQGVLVAARIEVKAGVQQPAAPAPTTLAGAISDFVSAASFRVRDQTVDASAAAFSGGTAANLANGRVVEVTGFIMGNTLAAASVAFAEAPAPEGSRLAVSGAIEAFASPASFRVNGQAVSAGPGTVYSGGTAADLANGRRVDVDGLLAGGVLSAALVFIHPVEAATTVTLAGAITDFVSAMDFRVNNQAITTTAATTYREGTAAELASGRRVEVTGSLANGVVTATTIRFTDELEPAEDRELEGLVSEFESVARFKVKGQLVDASAASFENGRASDLANGLKVHVKGPVSQGVLVARTLEIDR